MTALLDQSLAVDEEIGLILVLGAGSGRFLGTAASSRAREVVLLEADPVQAKRLRRAITKVPHLEKKVKVISAAVGAADGRAGFHRFNLQTLSSLRAPRGLTEIFPGLKLTGVVEVPVVSMTRLMSELSAASGKDVLIVDVPGEEEVVVSGLLEHGATERFGIVVLICGTTEHYAGSASIDELENRLISSGYRLAAEDRADPDRPVRLYKPDPLWRETRRLTAALAAEQKEAARLASELAEVRAEAAARIAAAIVHQDELGRDALETVEWNLRDAAQKLEDMTLACEQLRRECDVALSERDSALLAVSRAETRASELEVVCERALTDRNAALERLAKSEKRCEELDLRLRQGREEMHRTEGQVSLMKELLLEEREV